MRYKQTWPKKGDNPFFVKSVMPDSSTWASLGWLSSLNVDDSFLAGAFKESADKIVESISRGEDLCHPDKFFMPITYLYRHSFELRLKDIISMGIELQLIEETEKLKSIMQDHQLYPLWNYAKRIIEKHWSDGPKEDLSAAERIIQEFHNIDQSGQKLRYTRDMTGRSTLESLPDSSELKELRRVSEALFNFLLGCGEGLYHALEIRGEMLHDYENEMTR